LAVEPPVEDPLVHAFICGTKVFRLDQLLQLVVKLVLVMLTLILKKTTHYPQEPYEKSLQYKITLCHILKSLVKANLKSIMTLLQSSI
jgi:hypothetical protein